MIKVLFVGTEALPFAATGGLGDVLGSLPASLKKCGGDNIDVRVIMPLYSMIDDKYRKKMTFIKEMYVPLSWRNLYCGIYSYKLGDVTYYFLDNEYFFKRPDIYGNYDDGERFAFFCSAVLRTFPYIDFYPNILHAHDWQSALSIIYLKLNFGFSQEYKNIKSIFTIHNIQFQGQYDFAILGDVFDIQEHNKSIVEYDGAINLMKGAIVLADIISTVSPQYAKEILTEEYSFGLHHILKRCEGKLCGILNGIDYEYNNPEKDTAIFKNYSTLSLAGKKTNKTELQKMLGLPVSGNIPMLCMITRLTAQKGLDLFTIIAEELLSNDIQIVILGKGDAYYENNFIYLKNTYPAKVASLITYNRDLSKKIYAGADIFIMPSKTEPCGLAQMIASRYGAVPICRETGGLFDSIKGYYELDGEIYGNGFTFRNYSADELKEQIGAALSLYSNKEKWQKLVKKVMLTDFSWETSAKKYINLYKNLIK